MFHPFLKIAFPKIHPAVAGIFYILLSVLSLGSLVMIMLSTQEGYKLHNVFSSAKSRDQKASNSRLIRQPGRLSLCAAEIKTHKRYRVT